MSDDGRFSAHEPRNRRRSWSELTRGPAHRAAPADSDVPAELMRPASRQRELLVPAAVILAGVLAVVAVAAAVNWGPGRHDDPAEQHAATPPVLAPATDWNLPTPTVPDSGSATPGAPTLPGTPRPTSRSTPPSTRAPATTSPANGLTVSRSAVPSTVNLSAEGTRDWAHWGFVGAVSLERRKTGGDAIVEGIQVGPRHRHALSPQRFAWNDGEPVAATSGTPTGIRTCGPRTGFTISAPAGTATRTLNLYVGVSNGRGQLDAGLSTGGKPVTAILDSRTSMRTAVFAVQYRAARQGSLTVTWTTQATYDAAGCGGVAIQAATLR